MNNTKQKQNLKRWRQEQKHKFLSLYYKVKPESKGWVVNPGFIQDGKYTIPFVKPIF